MPSLQSQIRLRPCVWAVALLVCGMGLFSPSPALATFHEWKIDQFFSNADGSVQYIKFSTSVGGQQFLSGHTLKSSALGTYTFDHNLPGDSANRKFIIATQGYVDLPGGIQPDFVSAGPLFSRGGDTINFADVDSVTFTGDQYNTLTAPTGLHQVFAVDVKRAAGASLAAAYFKVENFAGDVNATWQNIANPFDIDGDGIVKPLDALVIIDNISLLGNGFQFPPRTKTIANFLDANGDNTLKPLDVLAVIDYINLHSQPLSTGVSINVPEPSSAALLFIGGVVGLWRFERARRTRAR